MQSHSKTPQQLFSELVGRNHFADLLTACSTNRNFFLQQYVPMAERLAVCVQDLPLSPGVYSEPGGALQFGLQAGLLAVRSCDAVIFAPKATAQERQNDDPLYRWCAYCATLASAYLMCAGSVEVTLGNGQRHSFAGRFPLGELESKYSAHWKNEPALPQQSGLIYLQAFFFPGQFFHLSSALLNQLGAAINPAMTMIATETPLAKVVRLSLSRVLEFQREQAAQIIVGKEAGVMADITPSSFSAPTPDPLRPAAYSDHATSAVPPVAATAAATAPPTAPVSNTSTNKNNQPASASASAPAAPAPAVVVPPSINPAIAETAVAPDSADGINIKVVEWVRAMAFARALDAEITLLEDGNIKFGRKALGFAASPKENFVALYEAGCVVQRTNDFAICNEKLAAIYRQAKSQRKD